MKLVKTDYYCLSIILCVDAVQQLIAAATTPSLLWTILCLVGSLVMVGWAVGLWKVAKEAPTK